jgi:methylated-DNA-[protein]-cysteine S-methyltransferase
MATTPFRVASALVDLAVTVADGAVTAIRLHGRAARPPETPLERQVAAELGEYFAGTRSRFTFPLAPAGTEFERRVWDALQRIPYGETQTYGAIAHRLGSPHAARAVGSANHKNPIPIVIPCHRVVRTGGGLGGYGGGLELKRRLLDLETRALRP